MSDSVPGPSNPNASASGANPLGGKVHPEGSSRRRWSGYSAFVRQCDACGELNPEASRFCTSCGADLSSTKPRASTDPNSGVAFLAHRLKRERRIERRQRPAQSASGQGWIAIGIVTIVGAVIVNPARELAVPIWIFAVASLLAGTWQLRSDERAMRAVGTVFVSVTALALAFVGYRAIQAASTELEPPEPLSIVATPVEVSSTVDPERTASELVGNVPMQGGNPGHTGEMPGPAPATAPQLAWQLDLGGELYGAPALAEGVLYATSKSGDLIAVDALSGTELWRTPVTGYVTRATPAIENGIVYVGSGFSFLALDAATGEQRWSVPLQYVGHASPTIVGDLIIVGSQERWMYGIDATTGDFHWRLPTEGIVFGAVAMNDRAAFYATDEGIVYSINLETGRMIWRQKVEGSVYAAPVISGPHLLVTTRAGETEALDLESGARVWSALSGGSVPPATNGDIVVVSAADGGVYGLDAQTGAQRWLFPTGKTGLTSPSLADGLALVGAGNSLLAIDLESGEAEWYYLAGDLIDSSPVIAGDHVFFGARDGFLNAIAESDVP